MATTDQQSGIRFSFEPDSLTGLDWITILLATATGLIHLYLFTIEDWIPFLFAGLGFFGAIGLLLVLPRYRHYLYPIGVLFVLSQIVDYLHFPPRTRLDQVHRQGNTGFARARTRSVVPHVGNP